MIKGKHFSISNSCSALPLRMCTAWTGGDDIDTEGRMGPIKHDD